MGARPPTMPGYDAGADRFAKRMLGQFPELKQMAADRAARMAQPGQPTPSGPPDLSSLSSQQLRALYDEVKANPNTLSPEAAAQLQEMISDLG